VKKNPKLLLRAPPLPKTPPSRYHPFLPLMARPPRTLAQPGSGLTHPLGATLYADATNFSIFSRHATGVELLFFDHAEDAKPSRTIRLDPVTNRTYHYWHVCVPDVVHGQLYGYRVYGPFAPDKGHRFNPEKLLLDPYGRCVVTPKTYNRDAAIAPGDNCGTAMKNSVVDVSAYDWQGDEPLRRPASQTIIYEMHVRGFTRHPNSGVKESKRGTYAGLIEKIPYLQDLGVTAVELLPVFEFDELDCPPGLVNYWGYAPVSFFSPHHGYSSGQGYLAAINEFRDMVKALHRAGIEVILDVVYNHTAEGSENGPTYSFKGIDNLTYYILETDRCRYANYSGTGNTFKANHPVVRRMIVDSLCYWVEEMHVDGFRFDLASILARDSSGNMMANPPALWDIESEPRLAGTKFMAEAWDAAGLYQVGSFVGDAWKEWNGHFRDDVRDFFRGADGTVCKLASRLLGSPDIYAHKGREAEQSVNFVTCHDGFTLNDLVSYERKHNEANCEQNRDGHSDNRSWNCGVEGPTGDPAINYLRNRQVKNFLATTLLSLGMPMLTMGDEVRRTQLGNNNAYCQDNEVSWFDWSLLEQHADIHRFVRLIAHRRLLRDATPEQQRKTLTELLESARKSWHGVRLDHPDWADNSHSLALCIEVSQEQLVFHWILNAYSEPLDFELPPCSKGACWRRWIDTSLDSPNDIVDWRSALAVNAPTYTAAPHSTVVLISESNE